MALTLNGTTGLSGIVGSAGTPALQGTDTNTGYFFGTDILGLSTGGSERLRIDSSGNLLVKTTTQNTHVGLKADSTAINFTLGSTSGSSPRMYFYGTGNGQSSAGDIFTGTGSGGILHFRSAELIKFEVNSDNSTAEALSIAADKNVTITDGDLVIGTTGHGIDFSINSDGSRAVTTNGNLFDDYEEGTFNAQLGGATNHGTHEISGGGTYTKIGRKVYMQISFQNSDLNDAAAGQILIKNLPFTFVDSTVNSSHVCAGVSCDFATTNVTYPHSGDMNRYAWQLIASAGQIKGYRINDGGGMTDWDASHWIASSMELRLNISSLTAT